MKRAEIERLIDLKILQNGPTKWKGHPDSGWISMPHTVTIYNGSELCDMAEGFCSCGAFHNRADWLWRMERSKPAEFEVIKKLVQMIDREESEK